MPTWKISGYRFYFRTGEPLKKHEPAHIHVITDKGRIQFWLSNCEVKKKEGNVNDNERNKIVRIVKDNLDFFLEEWEKHKVK